MDFKIEESDLAVLRSLMDQLDPSGEPQATLVHKSGSGITGKGERLLVLDASFNPMTLAHEKMAKDAAATCGANEILLMLSRANVDKEIFGADLGQRLSMLLRYSVHHPEYSVSGCSHARFVDKALAIIPHYPSDTHLCFVIGYDTLERLFDRRYYKNMEDDLDVLFNLARIIVANRDCNDKRAIQARMEAADLKPYVDGIDLIELPDELSSISSTQARLRVKKNCRGIQELVPASIVEAIVHLNLYQT